MQWEGERGGPGAAELVKEWLNMHLPSPEMLIKEERRQVPSSQLPCRRTCERARAQTRVLIYQNRVFCEVRRVSSKQAVQAAQHGSFFGR